MGMDPLKLKQSKAKIVANPPNKQIYDFKGTYQTEQSEK